MSFALYVAVLVPSSNDLVTPGEGSRPRVWTLIGAAFAVEIDTWITATDRLTHDVVCAIDPTGFGIFEGNLKTRPPDGRTDVAA